MKTYSAIATLCILLLAACAPAPMPVNETLQMVEPAAAQSSVGTPEQLAIRFVALQQQKDYATLYDLFVPNLATARSKEEFAAYAQALFDANNATLTSEKVVKKNSTAADAYYIAFVNGEQQRLPPIEIILTPAGWRVNGFPQLFTNPCADCADTNPDDCARPVCSATTNFVCVQELIPDCACDKDADCPSIVANFSISEDGTVYDKYKCVKNNCTISRVEELRGQAAYERFQSKPQAPALTCESLGCPGAAAIGRTGGWKYYPCDCPRLGWFDHDLYGNITCFASVGDAFRARYEPETKC